MIDAARRSGSRFGRRAGGRTSGSAFAVEGDAAAAALNVHLEDRGVVDEPVDGGQRHGRVGEDLAPFAERLVGGDEDRAPFVAGTDQLEQHAGLGLILGDVGEVVEDQEVEPVEAREGRFEGEVAPGDLELLDEVGGAGEQHLPSAFDQRQADGRGQMALSAAGRPEQEQVGPGAELCVAGGDGHDLGLGDGGDGLEVEGVQGLARRQAGLGEMTLDPSPIAFGKLVLGDGREESGGRPAFRVGLFGEARPDGLDGRQA